MTSEELVLLHHAGSQVLNIALSLLVVSVHASLELVVGLFSVSDLLADPLVDGLVLAVTGSLLSLQPLVQRSNIGLAAVVFCLGKVVQSSDLGLAGTVLRVKLAVQLGNVGDAGLVLLGVLLLQGLDLVLSEVIFSLGRGDKRVMILSQVIMVRSEGIDL